MVGGFCLYFYLSYTSIIMGFLLRAVSGAHDNVSFEWDGDLELFNDLRDLTSKAIIARYRGDLSSDSHYLVLRTYRDTLSQHIRKNGYLEECRDLMKVWKQSTQNNIRQEDRRIFLDVGANIGACSIYFSTKGIETLAFEPLPSNLHYFTKAVILNRVRRKHELRSLRIFEVALVSSNKIKKVQMNVQRDNAGNAMIGRNSFVVDADSRLPKNREYYNITVPAMSFDLLLPKIYNDASNIRNINVHLLKIDCQGGETGVLKGMSIILSNAKTRPKYIYTELDPIRLRAMGSSTKELCYLLHFYGYINNDGNSFDLTISKLELASKSKGTLAATNILARIPTAPSIDFNID